MKKKKRKLLLIGVTVSRLVGHGTKKNEIYAINRIGFTLVYNYSTYYVDIFLSNVHIVRI